MRAFNPRISRYAVRIRGAAPLRETDRHVPAREPDHAVEDDLNEKTPEFQNRAFKARFEHRYQKSGSTHANRKMCFDINCIAEDGKLVNVEMSLNPKVFEAAHFEYYAAMLFAS